MITHPIKRIIFLLTFAILTTVMLFSGIMTAFAWSDFTQSKTNDFRGTVAKTGVILHKYEKNQEGGIIARPVANAAFWLYKQNHDGTWPDTPLSGPHTTNISGKITVDKLNSGSYKFIEEFPGYGYEFDKKDGADVKEYHFEIKPEDALGLAAVEVTAYNRRLEGSLEITKTVAGEGADSDKEFEFTVIFGDGGSYQMTGGSGQITVKSGDKIRLKHGQKAVFEKLPAGLYYEIYETKEEGYISASTGNTGSIREDERSRAEFTNTYGTCEAFPIQIIVEKKIEGEIPDTEKGREFSFIFYHNENEPVHFKLKAGEKSEPFMVNSGDTYRVVEDDPFGLGYVQTSVINGAGTACQPKITVTYINKYIGTIYTELDGTKKWVLGGADESLIPENITVYLMNGSEIVQTKNINTNGNKDLKFTFTAPKYDENGKMIKYSLKEKSTTGFKVKIESDTITNTYEPFDPVLVDPPVRVTKALIGRIPTENDVFTFKLKALNGGPMPGGAQGTEVLMNITGAGEKDFGDIYFHAPGTYNYKITEVKGSASCTYDDTIYIMTVAVEEQDNHLLAIKSVQYTDRYAKVFENPQFTNDYGEPDKEETIISGLKTWYHGDNPAENQPESITVIVKDGDKIAASAVITEADHWQWSFRLPKYREDGKTIINYAVDENEIDGYTKTVDGHNLINTHESMPYIPGPDEILLHGKKTWEYKNAPEDDRPGRITVFIKNGNKTVKEMSVTAADNWQWSAVLPKTDKDGNIILYTIEEGNIPHYTHQVDGYDLINTYVSADYPGDSPKTGDSSRLLFWFRIMLCSVFALIITIILSCKSNRKGKYYEPKHITR